MPEALAVLLVFAVAVTSYVAAKLQTSNTSNLNREAELIRLAQYRAWLVTRRQTAVEEKWSEDMVARITEEIERAEAQIDASRRRSPG